MDYLARMYLDNLLHCVYLEIHTEDQSIREDLPNKLTDIGLWFVLVEAAQLSTSVTQT
jgi:hypothetical protein